MIDWHLSNKVTELFFILANCRSKVLFENSSTDSGAVKKFRSTMIDKTFVVEVVYLSHHGHYIHKGEVSIKGDTYKVSTTYTEDENYKIEFSADSEYPDEFYSDLALIKLTS